MTTLVTAATRHGSTFEIAEAIVRGLRDGGLAADLVPLDDVRDLDRYDAVVLGSGVYVGKWLKPARDFVERHAEELSARRTWLFSSGPIGDPPRPREPEAVDVAGVLAMSGASGHRLFGGKLDKRELSVVERAVVRAVGAQEGDHRDWQEIAGWAAEIAAHLAVLPAAPGAAGSVRPAGSSR